MTKVGSNTVFEFQNLPNISMVALPVSNITFLLIFGCIYEFVILNAEENKHSTVQEIFNCRNSM